MNCAVSILIIALSGIPVKLEHPVPIALRSEFLSVSDNEMTTLKRDN